MALSFGVLHTRGSPITFSFGTTSYRKSITFVSRISSSKSKALIFVSIRESLLIVKFVSSDSKYGYAVLNALPISSLVSVIKATFWGKWVCLVKRI